MRAFTFFDLAFLGSASLDVVTCDPGMAADGGGDSFECIPVSDYSSAAFPIAGVGFSDRMQIGNNPFRYSYGDSFDSYAVAFTGTMTANEAFDEGLVPVFTGNWITTDGLILFYDDFDGYTVEDPLVQTMNSGTGFSAAWIYGDVPIYYDDFDGYTVEDPLVQTMNSGTGFSAAWIYGDIV